MQELTAELEIQKAIRVYGAECSGLEVIECLAPGAFVRGHTGNLTEQS